MEAKRQKHGALGLCGGRCSQLCTRKQQLERKRKTAGGPADLWLPRKGEEKAAAGTLEKHPCD